MVGLIAGIANIVAVAQIDFLFAPLVLVSVVGLYFKKIDLRLDDVKASDTSVEREKL